MLYYADFYYQCYRHWPIILGSAYIIAHVLRAGRVAFPHTFQQFIVAIQNKFGWCS